MEFVKNYKNWIDPKWIDEIINTPGLSVPKDMFQNINIFEEIKKLKPGQGKEIHITDAIRNLIKKENKFYGSIFTGKYLDCGTLSGYINSGIQIFRGEK